jgi:TonB family protein
VDAARVAAHDIAADRLTRRDVTSPDAGPDVPWQQGEQASPALPQRRAEAGTPHNPAGRPEESARDPEAAGRSGGSADGAASARGAPGEAGDERDGGASAPAAPGGGSPPVAAAAAVAVVAPAAAPGAGGAGPSEGPAPDDAPLADAAADAEAPGWWRPMAFRVEIPSAGRRAAPAAHAASPTAGEATSEVQRPGPAAERGGHAPIPDAPAAPTPAPVPTEAPGLAAAEERAADPIADLRDALGWGGVDRSTLAPRATPSGTAGASGLAPTSQQRVVDRDADLDSISYVEARGTAVGEYTEDVYARLQRRWHELDLSEDDKALGVQGEVTVVFRVARSGKVSDAAVLRSSGHAFLDQMALLAVPERLPRIPGRIEQDSLLQEITFRYRNPLVSPGSR